MRQREKQRIFKRFMEWESVWDIYASEKCAYYFGDVEQAIRDCVNEIKKGMKC
jgi:hypothetical protein